MLPEKELHRVRGMAVAICQGTVQGALVGELKPSINMYDYFEFRTTDDDVNAEVLALGVDEEFLRP